MSLSEHTTDWPLGCPTSWGTWLELTPGGGKHMCNSPIRGHRGACICKCGDRHDDNPERGQE